MKYLVTGHLGFIGSHIFKCLKENALNEVFGFDIKEGNDVRYIRTKDLEGIDYVFHLAAKAKIQYSIEFPFESNQHNVEGTLRLLLAAKEAGVKRVIYSASSSAYGNQKKLPLTETVKPNPMSPYGLQKLVGEYYCKLFYDFYGLETVSLRYFNVYGKGMDPEGSYAPAIARFLLFKSKGEPLPVFGGEQTRDFTYVEDVVRANILAMTSKKVGKGEIINIGGGKNYKIIDVAKIISDNIEILPQRKNEPQHSLADISKAKKLLEWEPKVNLMDWLKKQCR